MRIVPKIDVSATDEVIDAIADIEMHRQGIELAAGLAASCAQALQKLHELLRLQRPDARRPNDVEAVMRAIEKVKAMTVIPRSVARTGTARPAQRRQESRRSAQRSPAANQGRKTMGRGNGR